MHNAQSIENLRAGKHFSASALKLFLTCPKMFEYQYVVKAEPEFRPSAFLLGRAVHAALAAHHEAIMASDKPGAGQIQDAFLEAFTNELDHPVPVQWKNGETADSLRTIGKSLVDIYLRDAVLGNIVAVEQPFQAEIVDPRTGEILEPRLSKLPLFGKFGWETALGHLLRCMGQAVDRQGHPGQQDIEQG